MKLRGAHGSLVSLICDGGERYSRTYYEDSWLIARSLDLTSYQNAIETLISDRADCEHPHKTRPE
jgi:cysteine synthase A